MAQAVLTRFRDRYAKCLYPLEWSRTSKGQKWEMLSTDADIEPELMAFRYIESIADVLAQAALRAGISQFREPTTDQTFDEQLIVKDEKVAILAFRKGTVHGFSIEGSK